MKIGDTVVLQRSMITYDPIDFIPVRIPEASVGVISDIRYHKRGLFAVGVKFDTYPTAVFTNEMKLPIEDYIVVQK